MEKLTWCIVEAGISEAEMARRCERACAASGGRVISATGYPGHHELLLRADAEQAGRFVKALRTDTRHSFIFPLEDKELKDMAKSGDLDTLRRVTAVVHSRKSDDRSILRHLLLNTGHNVEDMSYKELTEAIAQWASRHVTDIMQLRRVSGLPYRTLDRIIQESARKKSG